MLIASLIKYLASQPNVSRAACVQAGLIFDTGGEIYDRFRARLMIPIHDAHGRVVAFGARALKPPEPGKEAFYPK
jgi:DNA primase